MSPPPKSEWGVLCRLITFEGHMTCHHAFTLQSRFDSLPNNRTQYGELSYTQHQRYLGDTLIAKTHAPRTQMLKMSAWLQACTHHLQYY